MSTIAWYPLQLTELIIEGDKQFEDICRRVAQWRIPEIEIYDGLVQPLGNMSPIAMRQMLEASGTRVSLLLCAQDFASPSQAEREKQVKIATRYLDAAGALGARGVRVSAGVTHPGISRPDALALAVECLAQVAERAEERGLVCCIENMIHDSRWHAADVAAPAASFRDLVRRLDGTGIKIMFNTGNPPLVMADTIELLSEIPADKLYGLHLSERSTVDGSHCPLGDGTTPWDRLQETLRERGFDGPVAVVDGQTEGDTGTLRSLRFAWDWIQGLGQPSADAAPEN